MARIEERLDPAAARVAPPDAAGGAAASPAVPLNASVSRVGPTVGPTTNGSRARRGARRRLVIPVLLAVLTIGGFFGYRYWQDQQLYVSTDNAQVAGSLVQVGSLNAGRIASFSVDVG